MSPSVEDARPLSGRVDLIAVVLWVIGTTAWLHQRGWVGPDIDPWYGVGLVRSLTERPLSAESLGHVPKLAHLLLLAPAAALGDTPERWLAAVGIAALVVLLWCHIRWARAASIQPARLVLLIVLSPLLWRASLDGGSVAWGWSCMLLALATSTGGRRATPAWLALGALFRPECVGVGIALGIRRCLSGQAGALPVVIVPLIAGVAGTTLVDLIWSGRFGASSIAHAAFEAVSLERVRGAWGLADTAHPWMHLSLPLLCLAALAVVRIVIKRNATGSASSAAVVDLTLAAAGFSLVTITNVALGGTLFLRFLLPWVTVVAALIAAAPWPRLIWHRALAMGVVVLASIPSWTRVAPEWVGTYPTAESLLVARRVARATAPELVVAMDAGARAVALGSGVRPWKTTPWILQATDVPCTSHVVIVRGALLARLDGPALERCGPWQDFVVDSAQGRVNVRVLLARRTGASRP